jgi:type I restriction enzyme, S subunit
VEVLNNICLNITDCEHKTAPIQEEGISSIRTTDIKNGVIDFKGSNKVSEETYIKWTQRVEPQPYDLILAREAPVGQVGMIPKGYRACLGQRTVLIRPNQQKVYPVYLLYLLLSKEIQYEMKIRASGSTVEHLNMLDIRNLKLPNLPSLKVQQEIGDTLGNLDAKIDNLRRQNETLEEIARSIFKHWFIDFEFPNPDGKPYKSSGGAMVRSDLGDIPEGWQVSTIGSEVETVGGGTPSTTEPSYWENGDIAWYSPTDLTRSKTLFSIDSEKKITKTGLQKSSAKLFPKYSLLLTSRATIGEVTISTKDASTNQGFITIIPNEKFSIHFLHGWLLTKIGIIKLLASGSTFPEISKSSFRGLDFLIPLAEVLEKYDLILNPIYKRVENNIFQIQTRTKTRDALLPKLMSGQLRVKE